MDRNKDAFGVHHIVIDRPANAHSGWNLHWQDLPILGIDNHVGYDDAIGVTQDPVEIPVKIR